MLTTKASGRVQIFAGLNSLCRQRSSQPSKPVSINSGTTLVPGKLLSGRYQIVQVLGNGGFSQTYLAKDRHKPSNPTCVVKHFKPASSDLSFLQTAQHLFYTEAETLEKLGHHNQIPQLLGYFEEEQAFYLVQEYIDGRLLSAEMPPGYCWSEGQVIRLMQEVLDLLVFIHSHGVIHRDIKPDNLIHRNQDNKVVLLDFGAIKQIRTQTVTPQGHRSATTPIGTPGYMAAEQGQGNSRPNSDLYALGVIGVQALTGLDPTKLKHDPGTGEICWQQQAEVSPELASFVTKLVSYHFKDRYQSATEALEALQSLTNIQSSDLTRHLLSQVEASVQQPPMPSILLSQIPSSKSSQKAVFPIDPLEQSSELSQKAVFSTNPSEQPKDSKSRNWIWKGVGAGLTSAVALSALISLPRDSSVQQSAAKSDPSVKDVPANEAAPPNKPASPSSPHREERLQAADTRPSRVARVSPSPQNEPRLVQVASPDLPREKTELIAATANSPAKQFKLAQSPSNSPKQSAISPKAMSAERPDQPVKEAQGTTSESRNIKSRAELEGNLAELKAAFSRLAEAIALTEASAQGEVATQDTFDDLEGAIAELQQHVEALPSEKLNKDRTAPSTNSSDRKLVASLDTEVVPVEKLEEEITPTNQSEIVLTSTEQPEEATSGKKEEEATLDNSSAKEPELFPEATSSEKLEPPSDIEAGSAEELEEEQSPYTDLPNEQTEVVSQEQLERETAPTNSSLEEPEFAPETVSAAELKASPDLEVVYEEKLKQTTPAKSPVMSPDGQLLAGISVDNSTIKIWDVHSGELVSILKGHSSDIQSITISSDSQTLTSVSTDDAKTWNLPTRELLETPTDSSNPA